jgi:ATP-dependent protease HslVU (ClpYQ) peptidase subunit
LTCIVGLIDGDNVIMGGDSQLTHPDNGYKIIRKVPKVFVVGEFIIGICGSSRMEQLLRYKLKLPDVTTNIDEYMITDFVEAVRKCFTDGGFSKKDDEVESGGTFMVAYRNKIYTIYDDYQLAESSLAYQALGAGDGYALGSLYSTPKMPSMKRVTLALDAAVEFNAWCSKPYTILQTKDTIT